MTDEEFIRLRNQDKFPHPELGKYELFIWNINHPIHEEYKVLKTLRVSTNAFYIDGTAIPMHRGYSAVFVHRDEYEQFDRITNTLLKNKTFLYKDKNEKS